MAGRVVGSVSVTVVPDAATFSTLLRAQITPQANSLGEEIGKALSRQIAQGIRQGIIDGGAAGLAPAGAAGRASGDAFAGEFDRAVRTKLEAALRSLPPVNIGVATSEAEQKVKEIGAEIRALADQRIGIDINEGEALSKIQELRDKLTELAATSPSLQVKADTLAARDRLQEILLKADEVGAKNPQIDVDVNDAGVKEKLAADKAAADSAGDGFSLMTVAGVGLGPALIPVIAAVTAAMIGLASVIGAVGAGLGVLGLAFSGVSKAMQDLSGEQQRQETQAGRTGAAAGRSAAAQTSAAAQVKVAEESLANARENAKNAATNAAEVVARAKRDEVQAEQKAAQEVIDAKDRVVAARQQMADDLQSNADSIAAANAQVEQSERSLTDAQQRATDAQAALTEARKTAAQQLEDLSNQVIDGQNNQRQAELSLQTASVNLQNVTAPGSIASDQQRAQTQLDFDEAKQRLAELVIDNQRLADKKAEADAAGVEGSKLVTQAQRDLAAANQAVIDGQAKAADAAHQLQEAQSHAAEVYAKDQKGILDAQAAVTKAQQDGAQKIVDAQQKVSDALRAQSNQQRQSAFQIQQALESVAAAQRGLAAAGAGGGGSASTFDKYAADLKTLNPAVVELAKFIQEKLAPAFHDLQGAAAEGLAPGFEAGITTLLPFLPNLEDFVKRVAKAMGELFLQASKALTSPFWRSFGDFIATSTGPVLSQFAKIIGNLITGFLGLTQAFFPVTTKIGGGLVEITGRFADFGKAASNPDSPFQTFIRYIQQWGPVVVDTFGNIVGAIRQLIIGLAPVGDVMLGLIDRFAKFIATLDPKVVGAIAVAIGGLILGLQAFNGTTKLVEGANGAFKAFGASSDLLAAGPIAAVIVALAAAGVVIYELYQHSKTVHDFIDRYFFPLWHQLVDYFNTQLLPMLENVGNKALKGIEDGLGFVQGAIQRNKPELEELWKAFKKIAEYVITTFLPIFLEVEGDTLQAAFTIIGAAIATFITVVSSIVDVFEMVANAAKGNWDLVHEYWSRGIRSVIGLINDFIGAINKIPGVSIPTIPVPALFTAPTQPSSTTSGTGNGVNAGRNTGVAQGGVFPGYAPGVDSIRATLSPGEGVLVPEAVRMLGPDWVYRINAIASGGRAANPAVRHDGHFSLGGIVGGALGVGGDLIKTATGYILGPAEHAAVSVAERAARFAVDHAGLPADFRRMAESTINIIGDSLKFADGGVLPGGFIPATGSGVGYGASNVVVHGGPNVTYLLNVHNNRRDLDGGEVVTSINQMHAVHGAPLLAAGGG